MADPATAPAEAPLTSIGELRTWYATRAVSPVEFVSATIRQIEAADPALNAFVTVAAEPALAAARKAERLVTELGERAWHRYPLLGVPISVKDLTPTAGLRTTRGSVACADWVPDTDAPAVARLRAAGAIIIGKTNTSEFGWSAATVNQITGVTRNPWQVDRTAGGSSGGAAVAVATGMGVAATGTDGAGSIRIPASFCGVVGFKPSFGRVPYAPASVENLSHVGPLTRTVADAALLYEIMAGPDAIDPFSLPVEPAGPPPKRLRIGWLPVLGEPGTHPEALAVAERAVKALADAGHAVTPIEPEFDDPYRTLVAILAAAEAAGHTEAHERIRARLDPGRLTVVERGRRLSAVDLMAAYQARYALGQRVRRWLAGLDLLALPTVPVRPFAAELHQPQTVPDKGDLPWLAWAQTAYTFNLTGQPALSVPVGLGADRLPVGLQLVGDWRADHLVLHGGRELERAIRPQPIATTR